MSSTIKIDINVVKSDRSEEIAPVVKVSRSFYAQAVHFWSMSNIIRHGSYSMTLNRIKQLTRSEAQAWLDLVMPTEDWDERLLTRFSQLQEYVNNLGENNEQNKNSSTPIRNS